MRLLLADDDPVSRRLVQGHLEAAGYAVVAVDSGDAALRGALVEDAPRLLILDWMMPGLHGPEVISRLRRMQPDQYRYAILLTQRDGAADLVSGFESGADDYVRKPCDPRELVARVRVGQRILDLQDRLHASNQALTRLASCDPLTELCNRRSLLEDYDRASKRSRALRRPLSIAMIDIDHFKRVNDQHGHPTGDLVIRAVADRMRGHLRESSTLGRFGGEEFVLVEPDVDRSTILVIAERLRQAIARDPVSSPSTKVSVTVSIGVASRHPDDPCTDAELLQRADDALYRAKNGGRDRVFAAWVDSAHLRTGTDPA